MPSSRRARLSAPAALAVPAVLVFATVALGDLDVGFAPGTPLDWYATIPRKNPTLACTVPLTPDEKLRERERERDRSKPRDEPKEGSTGERQVEKAQVQPADIGVDTTLGYARIVTQDIVWHLKWATNRPPFESEGPPPPPKEKKKPDKVVTGGSGDKPSDEPPPKYGPAIENDLYAKPVEYPPLVGNDSFWLSAAMFLRKLLHPEYTSKAESLHYLIMMGEPSLCSLQAAADNNAPDMKDWLKEVQAQVKTMPQARPQPLNGANPEETMLLRLAAEDLTAGYVTAVDTSFARYLYQLEASETVPLCEKYLNEKDAHRFLRRNAAAVIGHYTGERVTKELLGLLSDDDGVVRERALDALVRRQELETVAYLETMSNTRTHLRCFALFGLGTIAHPSCSKTILKALQEHDDADVLWAAVPAAARCQHENEADAVSALKDLQKWLKNAKQGTFAETNPDKMYVADPPPDHPMSRLVCLEEMTAIALARLGDADSQKLIQKAIEGTPIRDVGEYAGKDNKTPNAHIPTASRETFGTLHGPGEETLLLALPKMGDFGKKRLEIIALDTICEPTLRIGALDQLAGMKQLTVPFLEKVIQDFRDPLAPPANRGNSSSLAADAARRVMVRARALTLLATFDEEKARKQATKICNGWDGDVDAKQTTGSEVVAAVRVLLQKSEKGDKFPLDVLSKCLKVAITASQGYKPQAEEKFIGATTLKVRPPVIEEILKGLGNCGEEAATKPLLEAAKSRDNPVRGAAVAALGGYSSMRSHVVDFLEDDDPWVRFNAYRVLRHKAPGAGAFADWLYEAKKAKRADAVAKWRLWLKEDKGKDKERKVEELADKGLLSWSTKDKDLAGWTKTRDELKKGGTPLLRRMLELAGDKAHADDAFNILRELTNESFGNNYEEWKSYLDSKK